jgi:hypothetical protein
MRERNGVWLNGRGIGWFGRSSEPSMVPFGHHANYERHGGGMYGTLVQQHGPERQHPKEPKPSRWQKWLRTFLRRRQQP